MRKQYIAIAVLFLGLVIAILLTLRGDTPLKRYDRDMAAILDEACADWVGVVDKQAPPDPALAKMPGYLDRVKALPKTESDYREEIREETGKVLVAAPKMWPSVGAKLAPMIKERLTLLRKALQTGDTDPLFNK